MYSVESGVLLVSEEEPQRNRYGVEGKGESERWEELGIFHVSTRDKFLKRLRWLGGGPEDYNDNIFFLNIQETEKNT